MSFFKRYALQIVGAVVAMLVLGFIVYGFLRIGLPEREPVVARTEPAQEAATPGTSDSLPVPVQRDTAAIPAPPHPVTGVRNGESFGPPAPDFALTTMDGGTFDLSEHLGEVVVVNFWATWCPPCREEMPGFIRLQREFGDSGVQFVGVSEDEEGFDAVRPFAEEMGVNYPLVVDERGALAARYGAGYALPVTFIINRKGQMVAHIPGLLPEHVLRPMLEELIRESGA